MALNENELQRARSYFGLDPDIVFLNHASHGPLPLPARKAYDDYLDSWQKTEHEHDAESFHIIGELRKKLAALVGAREDRIGLSHNTTHGYNIVTGGYPWKSGDNVVLSDGEFPAGIYPWVSLKPLGVELKFAPTRSGFIDEEKLISLIDEDTKAVSLSWVQFNNGYRSDIARLGEFCRSKGILLCVDAIQGVGVIPIDFASIGADLYTCGCAKWLCGPCGTGFFYLSEKAEKMLRPVNIGWLSVDWQDDFTDLLRYDLPMRNGPQKYESGTYAYQDLRALDASIDMHLSFDRDSVWEHIVSLTGILMEKIESDDRFELISSAQDDRRSGVLSFTCENVRAMYQFLRENRFVVSFREGGIRVSPHFYNTREEIARLIAALDNFR